LAGIRLHTSWDRRYHQPLADSTEAPVRQEIPHFETEKQILLFREIVAPSSLPHSVPGGRGRGAGAIEFDILLIL